MISKTAILALSSRRIQFRTSSATSESTPYECRGRQGSTSDLGMRRISAVLPTRAAVMILAAAAWSLLLPASISRDVSAAVPAAAVAFVPSKMVDDKACVVVSDANRGSENPRGAGKMMSCHEVGGS